VNLLVINRHLRDPMHPAIQLPFTPQPTVQRIALSGNFIDDNNEDYEKIALRTETIEHFTNGQTVRILPHSAVVFQFVDADLNGIGSVTSNTP